MEEEFFSNWLDENIFGPLYESELSANRTQELFNAIKILDKDSIREVWKAISELTLFIFVLITVLL